MGKLVQKLDIMRATAFKNGKQDPKEFTGSDDDQWELVCSVTSTLFFPTGQFVDKKAAIEGKRKLHDEMATRLQASKVSHAIKEV